MKENAKFSKSIFLLKANADFHNKVIMVGAYINY